MWRDVCIILKNLELTTLLKSFSTLGESCPLSIITFPIPCTDKMSQGEENNRRIQIQKWEH